MNLTEIRIIKRDGKQENFSAAKITNAIGKAFEATGIPQQREELDLITRQVVSHFSQPTIGVEEIQDLVENELMKVQPGSGQEIHYLPSVEKYGKRPEDAHQAYHGRHCGHRQE